MAKIIAFFAPRNQKTKVIDDNLRIYVEIVNESGEALKVTIETMDKNKKKGRS